MLVDFCYDDLQMSLYILLLQISVGERMKTISISKPPCRNMPLYTLSLESSTEERFSNDDDHLSQLETEEEISSVEDSRLSVFRGLFLQGGLEIDIVFIRSPTEICNNRI